MYQNQSRQPYRQPPLSNLRPRRSSKRRKFVGSVAILAAIAASVFVLLQFTKDPAPHNQPKAAGRSTQHNSPAAAPAGFNKNAHSTSDPISTWVVVNKQHPLNPKTYTPADLVVPNIPLRSNITSDERQLRAEPAAALETMVKDASAAGVQLNLQSGYRSYTFQQNLYNSYVRQQGQTAADRTSARPGHSEHQTGLAADLGGVSQPSCNVAKCYANTPEGKWLAANAYKYGFLVRYTETKESVTGYDFEPWHIRYIGTELATEMRAQNIQTLEEFFGIAGGTSY